MYFGSRGGKVETEEQLRASRSSRVEPVKDRQRT
jgi:hypothetical protein